MEVYSHFYIGQEWEQFCQLCSLDLKLGRSLRPSREQKTGWAAEVGSITVPYHQTASCLSGDTRRRRWEEGEEAERGVRNVHVTKKRESNCFAHKLPH